MWVLGFISRKFARSVSKRIDNLHGILRQIFIKSHNKIQDAAKLHKLVDLIDHENWVMMGADVKGDIYESLLEKNAEDSKSGIDDIDSDNNISPADALIAPTDVRYDM